MQCIKQGGTAGIGILVPALPVLVMPFFVRTVRRAQMPKIRKSCLQRFSEMKADVCDERRSSQMVYPSDCAEERNPMILDEIVKDKRVRLKEHKARIPEAEMRKLSDEALKKSDRPSDLFYENLKRPGISIIGEFKKASPSLGKIDSKIDLDERIVQYDASVDAISCLTEEDHFNGNTEYLKTIRARTSLPILRKDFMIEEYQFYEARAIGADAVLLITAILDDGMMKDFYQLARELKLGVLGETHDEHEIERALKIDPRIIGVNNRNLKDFSIDIKNTGRLKRYIPDGKVYIAESGIMNDDDVKYLNEVGVDGFLIGRALMENEDPESLAKRWKSL